VVEVAEHHENTTTFLSESVLDGYADIIECDVGGTGGRGVGSLDRLCLYAFSTLDKEDGKAALQGVSR
jgi:hypothetical protein